MTIYERKESILIKINKQKTLIEKYRSQLLKLINNADININKTAQEYAWEKDWNSYSIKNTIESKEDLINDSKKKLLNLEKSLENINELLKKEEDKEMLIKSAPQPIIEFVLAWKEKARDWYLKEITSFKTAYSDLRTYLKTADSLNYYSDERRAIYDNYYEQLKELKESHDPFTLEIALKSNIEELLENALEKEKSLKILDLINRVTHITGTITDASNLHIGNQSGELNGRIIGEKGTAYIETISAGGYNIQRFHYRVLVKQIV